MAKVNKQTKAEVAKLLRQLSQTKTASESARITEEIKVKVAAATESEKVKDKVPATVEQ